MAQSTNRVQHDVNAYGQSKVQIGNNYTETHNLYTEPSRIERLADLRLTNPDNVKSRIEHTKGGLLRDSYKWILDHEDFRRWRDDPDHRLLWIKGDAGKGKTMLLCGIIDELSPSKTEKANTSNRNWKARMLHPFEKLTLSPARSRLVSYFFCQGTDERLNRAVAVLQGLLFFVLDQQPSLISHVQRECDRSSRRRLFEDTYVLSRVLLSMLCDRRAKGCYMVVDALDECEHDLPQLLDFIVESMSKAAYVKWLISSRNRTDIEQRLNGLNGAASKAKLNLELNAHHVTQAVNSYIDYKVKGLVSLEGRKSLQDRLRSEMRRKAGGTFLWVALVAQELQKVPSWDAPKVLEQMPSGLTPLYRQMMNHIKQLQPEQNRDYCRLVISAATVAYRPLRLSELRVLSGLPPTVSDDLQSVIDLCASFLTTREDHVYLIHQSVKDFLDGDESNAMFQPGFATTHHTMFINSMATMSDTLQRDMYGLHHPGTSISDVCQPEPDPLAPVRYSCFYWVDHLRDAIAHRTSRLIDDPEVNDKIYEFLSKKYLYWLEALGLLQGMAQGVGVMTKLERVLEGSDRSGLFNLVRDARRFIQSYGWAIGQTPLQAYASALVFSPTDSLTRELFQKEEPNWITLKPSMESDWNACLQTLEGHGDRVWSVAFSADGQRLASGSGDNTVKIWDAATGACVQTLKGHGWSVFSVVFSADGQRLASGSYDNTVKIWDAATGACVQTLKGHGGSVSSVVFSADGQRLASGSHDNTVKIWDVATGACVQTLKCHGRSVLSVVFSADGQRLASGHESSVLSADGQRLASGHESSVLSADGQCLASGSDKKTIKIWDAATGACVQTLEGHGDRTRSVAFSADGQRLASGSSDKTVKIWDAVTGACVQTHEGHGGWVESVVFSADGQRLASGSCDKTVKIWDAATGACVQTHEGHGDWVESVVFSADGQRLASGSCDQTVKIWDAATGACVQTLKGHGDRMRSVAFSADGQRLASGSCDKTVKIWDAATGAYMQMLEGHGGWVESVVFSADGQRLASGSSDKTVKIWDAATGACVQTLEGHGDWVWSVAFSADGQRLASGSCDKTVKIWDAATGACVQTLEGHGDWVESVAFSADGQRLASGSSDKTVKIWDAATGACVQTLKGHGDRMRSVAFSADGQRLASGSCDQTVKIWDAATGACVQTLNVGRVLCRLSFDPTTNSLLSTNIGLLNLDHPTLPPAIDDQSTAITLRGVRHSGWGISTDGVWIVKDGKEMLWLPPDYRKGESAVVGSTVAIGCRSGRVLVMKFS